MAESIDVHKVFAEYFTDCEALAYALSEKLSEGNICLDYEEYLDSPDLQEINPFFKSKELFKKELMNEKFISHDGGELKPFIILNRKAYLQRYFRYETEIIESIKRLKDNLRIITGGPGSGKTYSVSTRLVSMLEENISLKVALAAPTGKAAFRMTEAIREFIEKSGNSIRSEIRDKITALKAETIHHLLKTKPGSVFFRHDEKNKLPFDVVVIDECSMVDGALMAKLLSAADDRTKIFLIGDKDQLASVEAGSVFGDICRAGKSALLKGKIEFLESSRRFDKDKGIGKLSREIIEGNHNHFNNYENDPQVTIDHSFSKELFEEYALLYRDYIEEPDIREALKKLNRIRFLCVTRENDQSVAQVNKQISYILSKTVPEFSPRAEGLYENQPIIVTQNDYNLDIFNGDVGLIRKEAKSGKDNFYAHFENSAGEIRKIPAGYLNNFETVFAMTIHKSQGSEFDNVVVILPEKQGERLLTRELLYTAVTRARSRVLIQTSADNLRRCVDRSVSRASGLEERLNKTII